MASSRKKQDEKNLKTIRELGTLPQNKYCFDCNQRGPTYVNVTIGSFVCTKCSGMLRGITPPHRVKSISMATFTTDEVDLLRARGNAHCRRVWLGLYDSSHPTTPPSDETAVKDFMVEKYERKRYYLEPVHVTGETRTETRPVKINGGQVQSTQRSRPEINRNRGGAVNGNAFAVDFDRADIFSGGTTTTLNNNYNNNSGSGGNKEGVAQQNGFANFDDNPVFRNTGGGTTTTTGLPPPASFNHHHNNWTTLQNPTPAPQNGSSNDTLNYSVNGASNGSFNGASNGSFNGASNGSFNGAPNGSFNGASNGSFNGASSGALNGANMEDKYAALKDLDNEIKSQKNGHVDWGSTGSNGSLYSSPTPTGSVYSSPSPQGSIFGSPSQGQFMATFPPTQETHPANVSNPFGSNGGAWGHPNSTGNHQQQAFANPFRDSGKSNGFSQVFQPIAAYPVNGTNGWAQNPFKVGGTNLNSNNPFL
ncbi:unnamed protein product [Phaedon cochleariae]|uniref:Arf-GAP domain-containing protein n=1 Tax=Phaedon cochleariae TaxID=80249 RepID=A0A9N9SIW8_PHACE|nr:unnamed protein product [Phaedon cochleariae]